MKKKCLNCGKEYETNYEKSKYCCSKCRSASSNKKLKIFSQRILIWTKKIKAIKLLGDECEECGNNNIFHLTFHHRDSNEKENTISQIWKNRWSLIEPEIKKCILLCDNCHRELHYNEKKYEERRKTKEVIVNFKGNKCEICGYSKCLAALTFHHKNEKEKNYEIAKISLRIENINELNDDMFLELEKCELLCANCHREKHIDINENELEIIRKKDYKEIGKKIDREEIFRFYFKENKKIIEISKILNCSKSSISEILKEERRKRNGE